MSDDELVSISSLKNDDFSKKSKHFIIPKKMKELKL